MQGDQAKQEDIKIIFLEDKIMNAKRILTIIMGIIVVASGVYCLFTPTLTYLSIGYIVGVLILCDAISNICTWFDVRKYVEVSAVYLLSAILSLVFGILIIFSLQMQFVVDMAIIYMIAAFILAMGIIRIVMAIRIHKVEKELPEVFQNKKWIALLIAGILMILFAILCMFKPIVLSNILGVMIGLMIIFTGISIITLGMYSYN